MLLCKLVTTIGSENQTPVLHVEAGGDGEEVCSLVLVIWKHEAQGKESSQLGS